MENDLIQIILKMKKFAEKYSYNEFKEYQYQIPFIQNEEERKSMLVFNNLVNHIDLCYLLNKKLDIIEDN